MKRFRQFRTDRATRDRYADVGIRPADLIVPLFVVSGTGIRKPIAGLDDVYHLSADAVVDELAPLRALGVDKVLLFAVPDAADKDDAASAACRDDSPITNAIRSIKTACPEITVITDICVCGYTSHGHCGIVVGKDVDNDATLPVLAGMASAHARAGADMVAPSAMMDGQVAAIRGKLDEAGCKTTRIMGYSAKYASGFYNPFRGAVDSAPAFGDRKGYQCDYRTTGQGVAEAEADVGEGADWIMVKPAHTYLDMLTRIKTRFPDVPLAAYHVSGEYMTIMAAAKAGVVDETAAMQEVHTAIKRAGADMIITYYAEKLLRSYT